MPGIGQAFMWAGGTVEADGSSGGIKGAAVVREAVGTYLITYDESLEESEGVFLFSLGNVGPAPDVPRFIEHFHVSPNQVRVWCVNVAAALFDHEFHFAFFRLKGT